MDNSPKHASNLIDTDDTITEIKKEKLVYENGACDIQVMCTLNSSFSVVDRNKGTRKRSTKRLVRNNRDEAEYVNASAKKRKYSTNCDSRSIDDSIKLEINNSTDFNGFKSLVSHDLNTLIKCESPDPTTQEITLDDIVVKDEISSSTPINSLNNNKQLKLTKDTSIISKKYDKCRSKTNSTVKHSKRKKSTKKNNNVSVDLKNVLKELKGIEENEQISDKDKEKLKNLHVTLVHTVPPQHGIQCYAGCRTPSYRQQKLFKEYGPLRKGVFSQQEDEIIKKNWEMFCKLHNWDENKVTPFLSFKYKGKFYIHSLEERRKFLQFLANGLPWRTLYSVYWRFKNLYRNHICKRYSPEEDQTILTYIQNESANINKHKKFSDLAKILKRTRHSIWMHYQYLIKKRDMEENNTSLSRIQWTLPLINRYIRKLLKITKCQNIQELKNAVIPKAVWEKLQTKLNIDYQILRQFWVFQLHMQLFCPNIIYLNDIKIQLIEYMYGKGISDAREIMWPNLIKYFDGMTTPFLNKTLSTVMKEFDVRTYRRNSFLDAIEYLYEKKIPEIKEQKTDKYLPRIQYTNGKIKIFSEEEMNKQKHK